MGATLGHERKPGGATAPTTECTRCGEEERSWSERWIECQMLSDLDLILSGAGPRRLAGRIGRSLRSEIPAAAGVLARLCA